MGPVNLGSGGSKVKTSRFLLSGLVNEFSASPASERMLPEPNVI